MTSDAKIGLLLGLVFIFVIAFIINGLPNFRDDTDNNELTTNMVSRQNDPLGLPPGEVGNRDGFNWREPLNKQPSGLDDVGTNSQTILSDENYIRSITRSMLKALSPRNPQLPDQSRQKSMSSERMTTWPA
jgi:hypothetical protein